MNWFLWALHALIPVLLSFPEPPSMRVHIDTHTLRTPNPTVIWRNSMCKGKIVLILSFHKKFCTLSLDYTGIWKWLSELHTNDI